ncbi:hypothetical protein HTZ84_20940 [Haloterrigena sp. SYSU A558-1]|uniref:Uncharacterized protein n=1 Tax=Haloterrigena gelatinilytica TaxID=2741724 RepID=A0ABX2LPB9_9EURY|nr:hypothetical protein [Haloterrigena gelatinilytica]NUC74731.1 hypothetical protein [Haloterrigena gelatinilytica]
MSEAYDRQLRRPRRFYLDETVGPDVPGHYDADVAEFDPESIWCCKQNHPELVVQDLAEEFGLDSEEQEFVRITLMRRGVNKWLYARRQFIQLKHEVKSLMKQAELGSERFELLEELNEKMQHIAKTPRWVEWPTKVHTQRKQDEEQVIIRGTMC